MGNTQFCFTSRREILYLLQLLNKVIDLNRNASIHSSGHLDLNPVMCRVGEKRKIKTGCEFFIQD